METNIVRVDMAGNVTRPKVIAHLYGSYWLCLECVAKHYQDHMNRGVLEPACEGDTLDHYSYPCDHGCGKMIQPQKVSDIRDGKE